MVVFVAFVVFICILCCYLSLMVQETIKWTENCTLFAVLEKRLDDISEPNNAETKKEIGQEFKDGIA